MTDEKKVPTEAGKARMAKRVRLLLDALEKQGSIYRRLRESYEHPNGEAEREKLDAEIELLQEELDKEFDEE